MTAVKIDVESKAVKKRIKSLSRNLKNVHQPLEECGLVLVRSITKNFKIGGRPTKWKPSKRATQTGGKTLIKTARLLRSITKKVIGKVLYVGTNVKYAAIHHFGGKIKKNATVKKHWRYMDQAFGKPIPARNVLVASHKRQMNTQIEARPYLRVQNSDWRIINRIFNDHVMGSK